jgi:hypothetical protein
LISLLPETKENNPSSFVAELSLSLNIFTFPKGNLVEISTIILLVRKVCDCIEKQIKMTKNKLKEKSRINQICKN